MLRCSRSGRGPASPVAELGRRYRDGVRDRRCCRRIWWCAARRCRRRGRATAARLTRRPIRRRIASGGTCQSGRSTAMSRPSLLSREGPTVTAHLRQGATARVGTRIPQPTSATCDFARVVHTACTSTSLRNRVEIAESAGADRPRTGETPIELRVQAERELGQVVGDRRRHRSTVR
jgi:hypothetical protein